MTPRYGVRLPSDGAITPYITAPLNILLTGGLSLTNLRDDDFFVEDADWWYYLLRTAEIFPTDEWTRLKESD